MPLSSFAGTLKAVVTIQNKISNNSMLGTGGMTAIDSLAICILADKSPISKHDLRRSLSLSRPQTERLLENFKKSGYVTVSDELDPKIAMASLTDLGREAHQKLETSWEVWIRKNPDGHTALASIRKGVRTMQSALGNAAK